MESGSGSISGWGVLGRFSEVWGGLGGVLEGAWEAMGGPWGGHGRALGGPGGPMTAAGRALEASSEVLGTMLRYALT